jgi:hypothetical protein
MGFIRYQNTYYKIVNDIVQSFILIKMDDECKLAVDILPLCLGHDFKKWGFLYHQIGIGNYGFDYDKWWEYRDDSEDIHRVVNDICKVCNKYLLDFFDSISDCNKYYEFITGYEEKYMGGVFHRPDEIYASLKSGFYEKAINHINIMNRKNSKIGSENLKIMKHEKKHSSEDIETYEKEMEESLSFYEGVKSLIVNQNYDSINRLLAKNEEFSENTLSALVKGHITPEQRNPRII